jgi:hypothetical protein
MARDIAHANRWRSVMNTTERRLIHRLLPAAAALTLLALSGCVAYPAGYGYGYAPGYAPGYAYAPAPYVYGPPVTVGVGVGCCWGGRGWGGHWR